MKSRRAFEILPYTKSKPATQGRLALFYFWYSDPRPALAKRFSFSSADTNPGHLFHRYITGSVTDKKYFASSSGDWRMSFLIHHCTIPTKLPAIWFTRNSSGTI